MIKLFVTSVLVMIAAIVLTTAPLYSQGDSDSTALKTIDGRVASVDPINSKIVVKTVETLNFSVPPDARIINKDGFDMKLSDIKSGNYVMIDYYNDKSGTNIASNIEVEYNR